MHDFVIRNALIIDGSGAPPVKGDVAVADGRISAIGDSAGAARETIDGSGLAVMPGIIDSHTHLDAQLTWDPQGDPCLKHGVTTVVIGNCGFTIAPCRPEYRDLTLRNLMHVEGMPLSALRAGVKWGFETFPEYLDMLSADGVALNVAAFVGHSAIRTYVLGSEASSRAATEDEIREMAGIVKHAVEAGAVGLSSTTNEPHNGEGGVPMPSRLADEREFRALAEALRQCGRGVFMITRGSTTSIDQLEELAALSERSTLVSGFLYNPVNPRKAIDGVARIAAARERGRRMWGEVSCCPLTMDFTLENCYIFEGFPAWKRASVPLPELPAVLRSAAFRSDMKADLERLKGQRAFNSEWHKLYLLQAATKELKAMEGKSIADIAAILKQHPLDALLDIALAEDLKTEFTAALLNSEDGEVAKLIGDPDTLITLSDAGAHVSLFCDAGFGLHLLSYWTRDRAVFPIEEAVRRLTSQPADLFGIADRGRLRPGYAADLVLFDPQTVGRTRSYRKTDLPGNAHRLVTDGVGVRGVWVNGVQVVDNAGAPIASVLPGEVIRKFQS
ncbi:N-acyl-D-amino-acid deacylase family protein [Achromobacter aloeverae]